MTARTGRPFLPPTTRRLPCLPLNLPLSRKPLRRRRPRVPPRGRPARTPIRWTRAGGRSSRPARRTAVLAARLSAHDPPGHHQRGRLRRVRAGGHRRGPLLQQPRSATGATWSATCANGARCARPTPRPSRRWCAWHVERDRERPDALPPGFDRHADALALVGGGACNPSGIALTLVAPAGRCARRAATCAPTPAVRLIATQIAFVLNANSDTDDYGALVAACRARAGTTPAS